MDHGDSSPAREGKPGAVASPRPDSIRRWSTTRRTLPGVGAEEPPGQPGLQGAAACLPTGQSRGRGPQACVHWGLLSAV